MKISMEEEVFQPAPKSLESYTEKEKWDSLSKRKRIRYLWDYYKLPFILVFIVIYVICFMIYRKVTYKDTCLYTGLINIAPTETTTVQISDDFMTYAQIDTDKNQFKLYTSWYLTTDKDSQYFEYTYASQMKILAAIDDEQLDIVLMDRESFDAFSQNGYLYNIEELLKDSPLYEQLEPYIIRNIEILEDNAKDLNFDPTVEYKSKDVEYPMGLDVSDSFVFSDAVYSDTIYLGVIANTPRTENVLTYLEYLFS